METRQCFHDECRQSAHPACSRALLEWINIRELPKVLLHEHLDGGLRPSSVIELAAETGYSGLPTTDPAELAAWFHR